MFGTEVVRPSPDHAFCFPLRSRTSFQATPEQFKPENDPPPPAVFPPLVALSDRGCSNFPQGEAATVDDKEASAGAEKCAEVGGEGEDCKPAIRKDRAASATDALANAIEKCDINPMESVGLKPVCCLEGWMAEIAKVTCPMALEEKHAAWEGQNHLASQLLCSIKQATKELNNEIKKADTTKKKAAAAAEKRKHEEDDRQQKESEERAKKELCHKKEARLFSANFEGHTIVLSFDTEALRVLGGGGTAMRDGCGN